MATDEQSQIVNFYNGGHVFITGGTGFLGRLLVEKLLRVCEGIERVYLLVREKKNVEPPERIKKIFEEAIFDNLRNENPNFTKKVTIINGDCSENNLGISEVDKSLLTSNVTHVFHAAANVRFDEKLGKAFRINIAGVRELLGLCHDCTNLKSIVHVSTAFSNCPLNEIEEKFYKSPLTGDGALNLINIMNDDQLDSITASLIKPWPNTYAFSKCIAENYIEKLGKGLPIAVVRPAIIIGCKKEPIPGWIDNIYGPTGVVAGAATGLLRVIQADPQKSADMVPADMAVNLVISSAWEIGKKTERSKTLSPEGYSTNKVENNDNEIIPIYNFVTHKTNQITWDKYKRLLLTMNTKHPTTKAIWLNSVFTMIPNRMHYGLLWFLYHTIPAYVGDAAMFLTGYNPQLIKGYQKISKFCDVISYFSLRQWNFSDENTQQLWSNMSSKDKELFFFQMKDIDWNEVIHDNSLAIREYILHDPLSTVPAARKRMIGLAAVHYFLLTTIYGLLLWSLYKLFS